MTVVERRFCRYIRYCRYRRLKSFSVVIVDYPKSGRQKYVL